MAEVAEGIVEVVEVDMHEGVWIYLVVEVAVSVVAVSVVAVVVVQASVVLSEALAVLLETRVAVETSSNLSIKAFSILENIR